MLTDIQKFRTITGDTQAPPNQFFIDDEVQNFLDMEDGEIMLAVADGLDSIANRLATSAKIEKIGDYQIDTSKAAELLRAQAEATRNNVYNTPAVAITEENLSQFAELNIIINLFQRTLYAAE